MMHHTAVNLSPAVTKTNLHTAVQTVKIKISWLLQKPADLGLHCHFH